ncbi:MAG TPA: hypothetical protein VF487_13395 [Chitinophagaceae bacterium]
MSTQINQPKKRNPLFLAGFLLLALTSIAVVLYVVRFSNKTKVKSVTPTVLIEGKDSIVQVSGKNFPDTGSISADFGGIPARMIARSDTGLTVVVNMAKLNRIGIDEKFSEDFVVRVDSTKILYTQKIVVESDLKIKVTDMAPKKFNENSVLTLKGNNLNKVGQIEVYFGKNAPPYNDIRYMQKASLIPGSRNMLKVRVPDISGVVVGDLDNVNIKIVSGSDLLYTTLGTFGTKTLPPIPPITIFDTTIIARPYNEPSRRIRDHRRTGRAVQ